MTPNPQELLQVGEEEAFIKIHLSAKEERGSSHQKTSITRRSQQCPPNQSTWWVMVRTTMPSPRRRPAPNQNPVLAVPVQVWAQVQAVKTPAPTQPAVIPGAGKATPTATPGAMLPRNARSGKRRNLTNPPKTQMRKLFQR